MKTQDIIKWWCFGGLVVGSALATFVVLAHRDKPILIGIAGIWGALLGLFVGMIVAFVAWLHRHYAPNTHDVDESGGQS